MLSRLFDDGRVEITQEEFEIVNNMYEQGCFVTYENDKFTKKQIVGTQDDKIRPILDYDKLEWIETATEEEITENVFIESVRFYNAELEFASKATAELACDIITAEMFEDVKLYMKSIDPYAETQSTLTISRPPVFDRYQ
jgi:hypothetical protein